MVCAWGGAWPEAHADGSDNRVMEWKSGCPSYDQPRPRAPEFTRSGAIDSILGVSRAETRLAAVFYGFDAEPDMYLALAQAHAHLQHDSGVFVAFGLPLVKALRPTDTLTTAPKHYWGNLVATLGYRRAAHWMGGAIRHGYGVKLGIGTSPWSNFAEEGEPHLRDLNRLADRLPFRTELMAHDRPLIAGAEWRAELIGCQGPFLRLRGDVVTWHPSYAMREHSDIDAVWVVPLTAAAGGYLLPALFMEVSVGLELRTDGTPPPGAEPFEFSAARVRRIGLYGEVQPVVVNRLHRFRIGAYGEVVWGGPPGVSVGVLLGYDLFGEYHHGDSFE